ncbi:TBC domain containing protein [Acanthamoeba castellanii str. Neff]|uniref:TBC domain containing protein n=1 Tax=Acanthamoeba castellanii (strain ATCC 30010 / Neff) TaxID=1257118 RepID=L8GFF5_ACACF|nr:TBC domain containing protein [Acanthamoeba castellanii str. Neff]ELR11722.1 TBC domain containing protein [Acanthamoeba castellanii str. Neff]
MEEAVLAVAGNSTANWVHARFGFVCPAQHSSETEAEAVSRRKEAKREPEWAELLGSWEKHHWKIKTLRRLALKGIPNSLRGQAWQRLTLSADLRAAHGPGCYQAMLDGESQCVERIGRDLPRTFRQHVLFKDAHSPGQQSLRNLLLAFWVFVRLTLDRNLEPLYVRSLLGLKQCLHVLDRLLAVFLPDLARHLGFDALFIMTIALLGLLADHIKTLKMDQILRFLHTELERGELLDVERLMKRYAKMSTRVRSKAHHFSRQHRALLRSLCHKEREGVELVSANKEQGPG